jgi:hypothetical protein
LRRLKLKFPFFSSVVPLEKINMETAGWKTTPGDSRKTWFACGVCFTALLHNETNTSSRAGFPFSDIKGTSKNRRFPRFP